MTSLRRKMARAADMHLYTDRKPQPTEYHEDGGYSTLHPTKGWQHVSGKRVKAREAMANKFGFIR